MKKRSFKPFGNISALTLGGGGLGQVWGETSREEAVATVNLAIEKGITHLDVAPMYGKGEAERVVGEVFKGKDLGDVNITTKCRLGTLPDNEVYERLISSLNKSLDNLNMEGLIFSYCIHSYDKMISSYTYLMNIERLIQHHFLVITMQLYQPLKD